MKPGPNRADVPIIITAHPTGPPAPPPQPAPARPGRLGEAVSAPQPSGPLTPAHLRELAEARIRARKVLRAASVAAFSGWTLACFALVTLVTALLGDLASLFIGIGLGVCAYHELRGGQMLRRFDPAGARRLGINQLALGVLIVLYAAWSLFSALRNPALAAVGGSTGDHEVDAMVKQLTGVVTYGLYGSMIVAGVVVPGLTALYYLSRGPLVRRLIAGTPPWVVDAMRATA